MIKNSEILPEVRTIIRMNDLNIYYYFITKSKSEFEKNYKKFQNIKTKIKREYYKSALNSYYYFQSYCYFLNAFLDNFAKIVRNIYPSNIQLKYRTFDSQIKWIKNSNIFPDIKYKKYVLNNLNWFSILKDYRDEFTHMRGYNPMYGKDTKTGKLELYMCGSWSNVIHHNNIDKILSLIHEGFEQYLIFCGRLWINNAKWKTYGK